MSTVKVGKKQLGIGQPCYVISEIGINHNGDLDIAKQIIKVSADAGCDAVKFQKRTPELCVPLAQRSVMRETPWGYISYMDYREKVEFGKAEYDAIDAYCKELGIDWFVSCWDQPSVDFIEQYDVPCYKVASASMQDTALLKKTRSTGKPMLLSTGMSNIEDVDKAVDAVGKDNLVLIHTVSTYPAHYEELNLRAIKTLRDRYDVPVGYSGHETGIASSVAAAALDACCVERHVTLDRAMWGSDQSASLEPNGITRLVRDIRLIEQAMGDGVKKVIEREKPIIARLRPDAPKA
jgi:N-acetylneuraminate synthase